MSLSPFNSSFITKETSSIPPDVVFQIVVNDQMYEVKAHKWVMATVSPVFMEMFSTMDAKDKTTHQIKVEQTTKPAFQIIIDAVYNSKTIEDSLKDKSVPEVFDVVNLIERYKIENLVEAILKYLSSYPISDYTVLEVAYDAMQYTGMFPREAHHLLLTCAKFLQPKLNNFRSIIKYAKDVGDNRRKRIVLGTLLGLMDGIHIGEGLEEDE